MSSTQVEEVEVPPTFELEEELEEELPEDSEPDLAPQMVTSHCASAPVRELGPRKKEVRITGGEKNKNTNSNADSVLGTSMSGE